MTVLTEMLADPVVGWRCQGWDDETEDECGAWRLKRASDPDVRPCWRCGDE